MTDGPAELSGKVALTEVQAFEQRLPLSCDIILDVDVDQQLWLLVYGEQALDRSRADFWLRTSPWYAGFALGIYGSLQAGQVFVACLILVQSIYLIRHHWLQHKAQGFQAGVGAVPQSITIKIDQDSMTEVDRHVEMRLPWRSMRRWFLKQNILFVELTNTRWLVIPQRDIAPPNLSIACIAEFLVLKGVRGKVMS